MFLPFASFLKACEFETQLVSAFVVIYNIDNGTRKVRKAQLFGQKKKTIVRKLNQQEPVSDAKTESSETCWRIVFYGSRDKAKEWAGMDLSEFEECDNSSSSRGEVSGGQSKSSSEGRKRPQAELTDEIALKRSRPSSSHYTDNELVMMVEKIHDKVTSLQSNIQKLQEEQNHMKVMLETCQEHNEVNGIAKLGLSDEQAMIVKCSQAIGECRAREAVFKSKLDKINWQEMEIDQDSRKTIEETLTEEKRPTKMLGILADQIFGDKLETHLLGCKGKRARNGRSSERSHTFSLEEENKLRKILSVFGDVFLRDKVWKNVVQYVINQKGRDKLKIKRRKVVTSSVLTTIIERVTDSSNDKNKPSMGCATSKKLTRNDNDDDSDHDTLDATTEESNAVQTDSISKSQDCIKSMKNKQDKSAEKDPIEFHQNTSKCLDNVLASQSESYQEA